MHASIRVQALRFQVGLAWAARVPTEFRLLNGLGPVMVGAAPAGDAAAMAAEGHDTNRLMQVRACHCILPWTESFMGFFNTAGV
jgi:hypothetical protein